MPYLIYSHRTPCVCSNTMLSMLAAFLSLNKVTAYFLLFIAAAIAMNDSPQVVSSAIVSSGHSEWWPL